MPSSPRFPGLLATLAAALALAVAQLLALPAQGADRFLTLDEAGAGALLLKTDKPGRFVAAPLVSSDIQASVTGPVVRVVVTQRFVNPSKNWVEAEYVFPLPEDAAVDTLRMRIGDRFVQGRIEERVKARAIYEAAKAEGKRTSLVEQDRPNVFRNAVANIGPGEVVVAQIEYQQALAPRDGRFELRVPLVVAPRFAPEPVVRAVTFGEDGWAIDNGPGIAPPVADPRRDDPETLRNPVTLTVDLAAGFDIDGLESRYHAVEIDRTDDRTARVVLSGPVPADRDFVLGWSPKKGGSPQAALLSERHDGTDHLLLMLTPPEVRAGATRTPREVIFVQDVSGSMGGTSIRQARQGLEMALRRLRPEDSFNIVMFSSDVYRWRAQSVRATPDEIDAAVALVRALEAGGGTNMLPALDIALDTAGTDPARLRQVIFLTDGAVTNEAELFALIERRLGRSRLFMVGIGSAPNGHFMVKAAEHGRGAHVQIGKLGEVGARTAELFARIETPALTDIRLEMDGATLETAPALIPDLYAGDPIVIAARTDRASGTAKLTGHGPDGPFAIKIPLDQAADRAGVAKLWARKRIAALETERVSTLSRGAAADTLDHRLLDLALGYGLVSRLTSLIAVDDTSARPTSEWLGSARIALSLPRDWDPAMFMGEIDDTLPKLAPETEERLHRIKAEASPEAVRAMREPEPSEAAKTRGLTVGAAAGARVPQGATNWQVMVWLGLLMMVLGLALSALTRRGPA